MPGVIHTFQRLLAFSLGSSVTKLMLRFCATLLRLIFGLNVTGEHKNNSYGQECLLPTKFLQPCRYSLCKMDTNTSEFFVTAVFTPFFQSLPAFAGRHTSKTRRYRIID